MARPIYRYEPNNSNPDRAVGIVLPFNKPLDGRRESQNYSSGSINGTSVFVQSYTTEIQSISNLKNLLLTRKGERFMQPNFGTDIYNTIFEQNTDILRDELEESLTADIEFWLPYIQLTEIDVVGDIDNYALSIRIRYRVQNSNAERVIIILANENEIILSDLDQAVGRLALNVVGFI
jgi:uncharacterized protein